MKKLLLCLLLPTVTITYPQNPKLDLSEEMSEPKRSTIYDIIGTSSDAFYAVRVDVDFLKAKLTIERYDKNYNVKISEELEMEADGDDLQYENTILFNQKLYVFGSHFSRKEDVEKLYAFEMDPTTLRINPKANLVATIESKRNSEFSFDISKNEQYLSIVSFPGTDDDNVYAYTINVYAGNLEEKWSDGVKNTYEAYTFYAKRAQVDDAGNVYVMAIKYDESIKVFKLGKPSYSYLLISHTEEGEQVDSYKLALRSGKFIVDINFRVMENGTVVCGGFYSDKFGGGYSGVCFFSFNPATGSFEQEGFKEFDKNELSEFMSERRAEKGKDIYNFDLRDFILREDGGIVMIAEYFTIVTNTYTSTNGTTRTTYTYYYNSLLVANVSPDMSIDWVQAIPKRQITSNDSGYYSSYTSMVTGSDIYVMFNDDAKNLDNLSENDRLANF
ncbi:MAG: hypothetical protein ACKVPJ_07505, partial [Chitinophagales bacterium]